ncbi:phosphoribosyltransferase-like protein [Desulfobacula toluolica]|uniref:Conserved uncharacterized protein n=1 Tax=Desulfobacula toluolica (strain DSM 7467 / Tol2) TaxID=651182 RepID=K0NLA5_DESTT|nr:hypothetical protein [Desulfobacula toluolica]CCK80773.1 conserved uncharacterized protein [Desulfobacula toluolica Tol2]
MEALISDILEVIKDYREDDPFFPTIDENHINRWICQFDEDDQKFLLTELLHILPKSYLSKSKTLRILANNFEVLRKDFGYQSVQDFLNETEFLDCQEEEKSQKILLDFVDDILQEKYDYAIEDCGSKKIKNWLYIDDVLASGGTFRIDIENEIENYGVEKFLDSNIRIIGLFFILHSWGLSNSKFVLSKKFGNEIKKQLKYYRVAEIDNNPHVNYYHPNPKFNHIYPIESDQGKEFLKFIEEAFERSYEMRNEKLAFRNPDFPKIEKFYSSKEDRIRYENIILDKGIQIINSIDNLCAQSLRPLGMAPPSFKTLGTGSHFFTWRNISNTCPLVYWWGANNWHPLFPVQNRGLK